MQYDISSLISGAEGSISIMDIITLVSGFILSFVFDVSQRRGLCVALLGDDTQRTQMLHGDTGTHGHYKDTQRRRKGKG